MKLFLGSCLTLAGLLSACASTPAGGSSRAAGKAEKKEASKESEQRAKEHAVHVAELELGKAKHEGEAKVAGAELSLQLAELELAEARNAMQAFAAQRDVKAADARLALDRAQGRATDAALELAELEAMYTEEEFAEKTKELVIQRGRREAELARRGLEIQQQKLQQLTEIELPADERERRLALVKKEGAVEDARRDLEGARLEARLSVSKAEEELRTAREELEELEEEEG